MRRILSEMVSFDVLLDFRNPNDKIFETLSPLFSIERNQFVGSSCSHSVSKALLVVEVILVRKENPNNNPDRPADNETSDHNIPESLLLVEIHECSFRCLLFWEVRGSTSSRRRGGRQRGWIPASCDLCNSLCGRIDFGRFSVLPHDCTLPFIA